MSIFLLKSFLAYMCGLYLIKLFTLVKVLFSFIGNEEW